MKKLWLLLLTCLLLAGCADEPKTDTHLYALAGNQEITLDAPAEEILEALGLPQSCVEEPSCAFDGMEKTYRYAGFYLKTYTAGQEERIFGFWFLDGTLKTPEGIRIGSAEAAVREAYGEESIREDACILRSGQEKMVILLKDGRVHSIQFSVM